MEIPNFFFSCDWGTSNFRLRLVRTESLEIVQEHTTDRGVKAIYNDFVSQQGINQTDFFCQYLKEQVAYFPNQNQGDLMVLSGMASSSIGLKELAYSEMPLAVDGSSLTWEYLEQGELTIVLVSGAKTAENVMRGEEVEAVGLHALMPQDKGGLLLLPGTHSKHLTFRDGMYRDFKTYMTGELFSMLSAHSILSNSMRRSPFSKDRHEAFVKGLEIGKSGAMTSQLFTIRVNQLFAHQNEEDNYYLLSGMLIGDELSYLTGLGEPIYLSASQALVPMYRLALDTVLASPNQITIFSNDEQEKSLLLGHLQVLKHIDILKKEKNA